MLKPLGRHSTSCLDVCLQAMAIHGKSTCTLTAKHNQKHIDRCSKFRPQPPVLGPAVLCGAKHAVPYQPMFVRHDEKVDSGVNEFVCFLITAVVIFENKMTN